MLTGSVFAKRTPERASRSGKEPIEEIFEVLHDLKLPYFPLF